MQFFRRFGTTRIGYPESVFPSIASRQHAVVIKPFTVILVPLQRSQEKFCVDEMLCGYLQIVVDLSTSSPGIVSRSFEKSLEFLEQTADYADFTGGNREDLPDKTTDVASACTKPK